MIEHYSNPNRQTHTKFISYWIVTSQVLICDYFTFSSIIVVVFNIKSTLLPHSPQQFAKHQNWKNNFNMPCFFIYIFFRVVKECDVYLLNHFNSGESRPESLIIIISRLKSRSMGILSWIVQGQVYFYIQYIF